MNGKYAAAGALGITAVALLAGVGLGQSMSAHPAQTAAHSTPQPTATVTSYSIRDEVPQPCLDALDEADTGFGYASDALRAVSSWMGGTLDTDAATVKVGAAARNLTAAAPQYNADKADCRAAAGQ